jgi:acyl carrier protein
LVGRADHQVKIRGIRIELGEIEKVLGTHRDIQETVVNPQGPENTQHLLAYVVAKAGTMPGMPELRRYLRDRLPEYMMPARFVFLPKLPQTSNGKVDRRGLPSAATRPELDVPWEPPRNPCEAALSTLWAEVLGLDRVGIQDDFIELGGDSLYAVQILARVWDLFGVEIPLLALLEQPTVAQLARWIKNTGVENYGEGG